MSDDRYTPANMTLEEEVKFLRAQLAEEVAHENELKLRAAFALTPQQSWVLTALYASKRRAVSGWWIEDNMPSHKGANRDYATKQVQVIICKLRQKLPPDSIKTVWNEGYALTEQGRAVVATTLNN